jgi:hypothetical protein
VRFTELGAETADALQRDQQEYARVLFDGMPQARLADFVRGLDAVLDRLRELVALDERETDHA